MTVSGTQTQNDENESPTADLNRVTWHGWFGFEGFGRPIESWVRHKGRWRSLGRCFTYRGALKRSRNFLKAAKPKPSDRKEPGG